MQFEEEIIPYFELALRECFSPQHQDGASDDSIFDISDIYDSEMDEDDFSEHDAASRPKCADKTIEAVGDLAGNPLDPRKIRSQFHNAYFASEVSLDENCYMIIICNPYSYQE